LLQNKTIAVVVPAYNEEKQIGHVIEYMPEFVNRILVANNNSVDATADIVKQHMEQNCQDAFDLLSVLNAIRPKTNHNIFKLKTVQ
jgi:glycosyltransferase involved in cell wall biosynthesis